MATDASKVRVAVTGAVYFDSANTATAPTGNGERDHRLHRPRLHLRGRCRPRHARCRRHHPIKAWQNGATVRVLRSAPDDVPTLSSR
jgi:hypothetical protein